MKKPNKSDFLPLILSAISLTILIKSTFFSSELFFQKGITFFVLPLLFLFGLICSRNIKSKSKLLNLSTILLSFAALLVGNYIVYKVRLFSDSAIYILFLYCFISGFLAGEYFFHVKKTTQSIFVLPILCILLFYFNPDNFLLSVLPNQEKYYDVVIHSESTDKYDLDVTQWKTDYWAFINGKNQFSTLDSHLYYEPMAHIPLLLKPDIKNVLIIGGENGLLIRELNKYDNLLIELIPEDKSLMNFYKNSDLGRMINNGSLQKLSVPVTESFTELKIEGVDPKYDVIYADLSSTISEQLYYKLHHKAKSLLKTNGIFICQTGDPIMYFSDLKNVKKVVDTEFNYSALMHNEIPTIGHWSWLLCSQTDYFSKENGFIPNRSKLTVKTIWLTNNVVPGLFSFGEENVSALE